MTERGRRGGDRLKINRWERSDQDQYRFDFDEWIGVGDARGRRDEDDDIVVVRIIPEARDPRRIGGARIGQYRERQEDAEDAA